MVKILVVEDDVRLNRLVCRLLSDYGYQRSDAAAPQRLLKRWNMNLLI